LPRLLICTGCPVILRPFRFFQLFWCQILDCNMHKVLEWSWSFENPTIVGVFQQRVSFFQSFQDVFLPHKSLPSLHVWISDVGWENSSWHQGPVIIGLAFPLWSVMIQLRPAFPCPRRYLTT
jgi:hypothetical protein